jgi:hypothetical protein
MRYLNLMPSARLLAAAVTLALGACGGGASSSNSGAGPSVAPASFDQVVPGATMTWDTSHDGSFSVQVSNAAGAAAASAAVRLFTLSMVNLDDGSPLEEPIAVALLDTTMTDGTGLASFSTHLPATLSEVLMVVTWDDQHVSRRVILGTSSTTVSVSTAL